MKGLSMELKPALKLNLFNLISEPILKSNVLFSCDLIKLLESENTFFGLTLIFE